MPSSPQRNTRVGKRPRAFPERRGGPSEASHAWASCDSDPARLSPMIPSEEKSGEEYVGGGGVVSPLGSAREKNKRTGRNWNEDKSSTNIVAAASCEGRASQIVMKKRK